MFWGEKGENWGKKGKNWEKGTSLRAENGKRGIGLGEKMGRRGRGFLGGKRGNEGTVVGPHFGWGGIGIQELLLLLLVEASVVKECGAH